MSDEEHLDDLELRYRAITLARTLFEDEPIEPPPAYTEDLPVVQVTSEGEEALPPVEVDEEVYEPEPPRIRFDIPLWHLAAEVVVEHQVERGELLAWRNRSEAAVEGEATLDAEAARAVAERVVGEVPTNADGPSVAERGDEPEKTFEVSWVHFVPGNVLVDGDLLLVRVNAATGRPYTLFRKWREVPDERAAPEAREAAPA